MVQRPSLVLAVVGVPPVCGMVCAVRHQPTTATILSVSSPSGCPSVAAPRVVHLSACVPTVIVYTLPCDP